MTLDRQFGSMTEKVADYEKLLKDLASRVGDTDAQLIRTALERVSSDNKTPSTYFGLIMTRRQHMMEMIPHPSTMSHFPRSSRSQKRRSLVQSPMHQEAPVQREPLTVLTRILHVKKPESPA